MNKFIKKVVSIICMLTVVASGIPVCASSEADAQRAEYYKEYQEIAERLSKETGTNISVWPAEEFTEDDWRSPEEFEEIARQLISAEIVLCDNEEVDGELLLAPRSSVLASKSKSFIWGDSHSCTIKISASFTTQYNAGRQYISSVKSINSTKTNGNGTWSQKGADYVLLDAGRTAEVTVSGQISYVGMNYDKDLRVEFYCNASGGVS